MADNVPFFDLKQQTLSLRDELLQVIEQVVLSGQFVLGPEVSKFESEFAEYCQAERAVGVSSGTSALYLALLALGIGPGDEVITTAGTFVATVAAIEYTGAKPVLVDIDPKSWTIDPDGVEAAVTERTKAILPVHLYGLPADMDRINALANARGIFVVEDACQAHGALYRGKRAGCIGDVGCFSFYPAKNLGAFGDGGALTTSDGDLADKVATLRHWGQATKNQHDLKGGNHRLDSIQAAVLRVKLRQLDNWINARNKFATRYREGLAGSRFSVQAIPEGCGHAYHLFVIRAADRDALRDRLQADGISTGMHYPLPIHLQPAYSSLSSGPGSLPHAEEHAQQCLSLPLFPEMTEEHVERVVDRLIAHQ